MTNPNRINLIFVVNGEDVPVEANVQQPLQVARNEALRDSGNTGRGFDEWLVRTVDGKTLEAKDKIESFGFSNGTKLLVSLGAGIGG